MLSFSKLSYCSRPTNIIKFRSHKVKTNARAHALDNGEDRDMKQREIA